MTAPALVSVIDDDEHARVAMTRLIRMLGLKVRAFPSAQDFLASPFVSQSDCIVSDLRMPGMHGIDLLHRLGALGLTPPIIFVTAHPEDANRLRCKTGGPVCVLRKPFDADALEACLWRALGQTD